MYYKIDSLTSNEWDGRKFASGGIGLTFLEVNQVSIAIQVSILIAVSGHSMVVKKSNCTLIVGKETQFGY